jgi:D-alanine-D-alanine ligase
LKLALASGHYWIRRVTADSSKRIRLALLLGGRSPEHDVSITSARSVYAALDPSRFDVVPMAIGQDGRWLPIDTSQALLSSHSPDPGDGPAPTNALVPDPSMGSSVDVVFPLLHGPFGEDGTVQGLLELLDVPYVGAGVAASAVGMDKALMKSLFAQAGLPVLPHSVVRQSEWTRDRARTSRRLVDAPGFPCFVKPANMGSSVGISRCDAVEELGPALDRAFAYDIKALVEKGVPGYREIECGVLGNDDPRVSVPGEIVVSEGFYDYHAKYTDGAARLRVPANVREETCDELQSISLGAFTAIDAAGMARVDFLVSPDETEIWLSEINTIPGFTPLSMYPLLWQASGVSYAELVQRLVELALERHAAKTQLHRDRLPQEDA